MGGGGIGVEDLLSGPRRRGRISQVEMNDFVPVMMHEDQP